MIIAFLILFLDFSHHVSVGIGLLGDAVDISPLALLVDEAGNTIFSGKNNGSIDGIQSEGKNIFFGMMDKDGSSIFLEYRDIKLDSNGVGFEMHSSCMNGSSFYFFGLLEVSEIGEYEIDGLSFNSSTPVLFKYDENGYVLTKLYPQGNAYFTDCIFVEQRLYVVGSVNATNYFQKEANGHSYDPFIAELDSNGDLIWSDVASSPYDLTSVKAVEYNSTHLFISYYNSEELIKELYNLNERSGFELDLNNTILDFYADITGFKGTKSHIFFGMNENFYWVVIDPFSEFPDSMYGYYDEPIININTINSILLDNGYIVVSLSFYNESIEKTRKKIMAIDSNSNELLWTKTVGKEDNLNKFVGEPLISYQKGSDKITVMFSYSADYEDQMISNKNFIEIVQFNIADGSTNYTKNESMYCYFDEEKFLISDNLNYTWESFRREADDFGTNLDTCDCGDDLFFSADGKECVNSCPTYVSSSNKQCVDSCGDIYEYLSEGVHEGNNINCLVNCNFESQYTPVSGYECTTNCSPYFLELDEQVCKENCDYFVDSTNTYCTFDCLYFPHNATIGENTKCTEKCTSINQYFPVSGKECQVECENFNNGTHCINNCSLLKDGKNCVSSCPQGKFALNGFCENCLTNCEVCNSNTNCSKCFSSYLFNIEDNSVECLSSCPQGRYENEGICENCPENCITCQNSSFCENCTGYWDGDLCEECKDGYELDDSLDTCVEDDENPSSATTAIIISSIAIGTVLAVVLVIVVVVISIFVIFKMMRKRKKVTNVELPETN